MPERIDFSIGVPGRSPLSSKPNLSLARAIALLKDKHYPPEIEAELIRAIKSQPSNTYENFLRNIHSHMCKLRRQKAKKKKDETNLDHDN